MSGVALPLESKDRELHGKLWLGIHLLERGHDILLGPSWEVDVMLGKIKPDVYISQGPGDPNIKDFDKFRKAGIRVYGLPTESGVVNSVEKAVLDKQNVVEHLDGFFCWGEKYKKELSKYYSNKNNIYVTGNPRFDLQNEHFREVYKKGKQKINKKYEDFILVNTNFSIANAVIKDKALNKVRNAFGEFGMDELRYREQTFRSFINGILHISGEISNFDIVVRPHPGEKKEFYKNLFKRYSNVHVRDSGDVREWIAAADVVMHHDCTTGIESVFMRTPVLSYRPMQSQDFGGKVPQEVSHEVFERSSLVEKIQEIASEKDQKTSKYQTQILRPYFANIDFCAATAICDIIENVGVKTDKDYKKARPSVRKVAETRIRATRFSKYAEKLYDYLRSLSGSDWHKKQREKRDKKFPGLTAEEIAEITSRMENYLEPICSINKISGTNDTYIIHSK